MNRENVRVELLSSPVNVSHQLRADFANVGTKSVTEGNNIIIRVHSYHPYPINCFSILQPLKLSFLH